MRALAGPASLFSFSSLRPFLCFHILKYVDYTLVCMLYIFPFGFAISVSFGVSLGAMEAEISIWTHRSKIK